MKDWPPRQHEPQAPGAEPSPSRRKAGPRVSIPHIRHRFPYLPEGSSEYQIIMEMLLKCRVITLDDLLPLYASEDSARITLSRLCESQKGSGKQKKDGERSYFRSIQFTWRGGTRAAYVLTSTGFNWLMDYSTRAGRGNEAYRSAPDKRAIPHTNLVNDYYRMALYSPLVRTFDWELEGGSDLTYRDGPLMRYDGVLSTEGERLLIEQDTASHGTSALAQKARRMALHLNYLQERGELHRNPVLFTIDATGSLPKSQYQTLLKSNELERIQERIRYSKTVRSLTSGNSRLSRSLGTSLDGADARARAQAELLEAERTLNDPSAMATLSDFRKESLQERAGNLRCFLETEGAAHDPVQLQELYREMAEELIHERFRAVHDKRVQKVMECFLTGIQWSASDIAEVRSGGESAFTGHQGLLSFQELFLAGLDFYIGTNRELTAAYPGLRWTGNDRKAAQALLDASGFAPASVRTSHQLITFPRTLLKGERMLVLESLPHNAGARHRVQALFEGLTGGFSVPGVDKTLFLIVENDLNAACAFAQSTGLELALSKPVRERAFDVFFVSLSTDGSAYYYRTRSGTPVPIDGPDMDWWPTTGKGR